MTQDKPRKQYKEQQKEWYQNHKELTKQRANTWKQNNPDKIHKVKSEWQKRNPEKCREKKQRWRQRHKELCSLSYLAERLRKTLHAVLKQYDTSKPEHTLELIGCSVREFYEYIGERPTEDAQLDHICPNAQATTKEELIKLQHYTNFQWLDPISNLQKRDYKTPKGEEMCRKLLNREWIA